MQVAGIDPTDTSWMLISSGLVMMMTPALGLFEAGLIRRKNALSVMVQTFFGLAILSILWFVIGFTLVFAPSQAGFIGGPDFLFFNNVPISSGLGYAPTIPGVTFASFQMMFAVVTPLLITGAFAERMKWSAFVVFIIAWSVLVYYPLAHWVWGNGGWLGQIHVFDFAGGIVIHTSAGMSSLAAAIALGRRKDFPPVTLPHNIPLAVIGAMLLWLGWFGFNAGSAFASGSIAANTFLVTQIASATSAAVWGLLSWQRAGKISTVAVISGSIAGLAGVTPASGFISAQSSFILGIIVGFASYLAAIFFKERLKIDDTLDVSSVHGVTGIIGSLSVGIIASKMFNASGPDGWLYGNASQLAAQSIGVAVAIALGFLGTLLILKVIDATIGLRVSISDEDAGLDLSQHSERAYLD